MEKPKDEGRNNPNTLGFAILAVVTLIAFFSVSPALRPIVVSFAAVAAVFLFPQSNTEEKRLGDEKAAESATSVTKPASVAPSETSAQSSGPGREKEKGAQKDATATKAVAMTVEDKAADYLRAAGASPGAKALAAAMKAKASAAAAKAAARPITGAPPPSTASPSPSPSHPSGLAVLYGSQTGNAMEIAKTIHAEAVRRGLNSRLAALNDFGLDRLREVSVAVFVVSSTGDGDPPENCDRFVAALQRKAQQQQQQGSNLLAHLRYTVCGLGDSNYTRFMAAPRILSRRLPELGATVVYPNCEADEVEGLDEIVEAWADGLWEPIPAALAAPPVPATDTSAVDAASTVEEAEEEKLVGVAPLQPCRVRIEWEEEREGEGEGEGEGEQFVIISPREAKVPGAAESTAISCSRSSSSSGTVSPPPPTLYDHHHPFPARVLESSYLTPPSSDRTVIRVKLAAPPPSDMPLRAGDSLAVVPRNSSSLVDSVIGRLGWRDQADRPFTMVDVGEGEGGGMGGSGGGSAVAAGSGSSRQPGSSVVAHIPPHCTLRSALLHHCDITGVARKSLLRVLAEYCSSPAHRHRLLLLTARSGREAYKSAVLEARPGLLELLLAFPSCQPDPAHLLDALPPLTARMYSLSSSPLADPTTCEFVFSVVHMRLPGAEAVSGAGAGAGAASESRVFEGVCTSWLEGILPVGESDKKQRQATRRQGVAPTDSGTDAVANERGEGATAGDAAASPVCVLPVYHKPGGSFSHPASLAAPMIMIGPGTGVAPFRGFLQERRERMRGEEAGSEVGDSWLFFGCRRREEDYIYGEELEGFERDGTLTHLEVAFSRETEEKVYVQHRMAQRGAELCALLTQSDTHVYVCGDGVQMAKDVHSALLLLLSQHTGMQESTAVAHMAAMVKEGRYIRDVWS